MNSSTQTGIHIRNTGEDFAKRIRVRTHNYDTWATAGFEIDHNDLTLFLHGHEMIREMATQFTAIGQALFNIANEQELAANAKEQANLVGS